MVLQRDRPVTVWGTADPGERVTVTFAGQTKAATANSSGNWRVALDPMPASKESRTLTVASRASQVSQSFADILVGEVWLCSGQSNADLPIWGEDVRYRDGWGAMMLRSTVKPFVRLVKVKQVWTTAPNTNAERAVWRKMTPELFAAFKKGAKLPSAMGYYYALELANALDIPIGLVDASMGGTNIDAWTPRSGYASHPELKDVADYPLKSGNWDPAKDRVGPISGLEEQPTVLWNGLVAPYAPMAIRGFIWYQGCHNVWDWSRYAAKMHALYDGWAKEFENSDLELYFAQIAWSNDATVKLKLEQARFAAEEPHAAMAVLSDAGNPHDIHPNDKRVVAKRLSLHALKRLYGFDGVENESPTVAGWKVEGVRVTLSFDHADEGWYVYNPDNTPANGFELAGADGVFRSARIVNLHELRQFVCRWPFRGTNIVLEAEGVTEPHRVRYLFRRPWYGSVYTGAGLPLGPFEISISAQKPIRPVNKKRTLDECPQIGFGQAVAARRGAAFVPFDNRHVRIVAYHLVDQTDYRNELVHKDEWLLGANEGQTDVRASLLAVEDVLTGEGAAYLRLAPLPHARIDTNAVDFAFAGRGVSGFGGRGLAVRATDYPWTAIPYAGGAVGRTKALQDYQRKVRPYVSGRDGLFLCNTWGDRNRDTRINEAFLLGEVQAAAELGVEVLQVDDGWQCGKSMNSAFAGGKGVLNGYWAASPDFWVPDPKRFPQGLSFVTRAAAGKGIRFGLWFGPDSSNDAANWERDADWLLKLHRECGIDYFKLDSMKTTGAVSLERQTKLFDRLLRDSNGRIVVDMDVTAERRPGYFGLMKAGPLFVENRYTDWKTYWPHLTLRSLWSLAEVIDPIRLRMEVLNPLRNREKYGDDPLAPAAYPAETLFAIALPASPLGWFEVQNLAPETVAVWKPLVAAWKRERDSMAACNVLPVGACPDGVSWTGFVFVPREKSGSGYALLFRELSEAKTFAFDFAGVFPGKTMVSVLSPRGCADLQGVSLERKRDFVWVKFVKEK